MGITAGPDGNLWFTELLAGCSEILPAGRGSPRKPRSAPCRAAASVRFRAFRYSLLGNKIGRITPGGALTEFNPPTAGAAPTSIVSGPDGNLWFTESGANQIGRITPAGVVTEYTLPTPAAGPTGIALGSDGNLWFTEFVANKIGRITTSGSVSEFALPTAGSGPSAIAAGPDSALWITELGPAGNKIGRIAPP